MTDNKISVLFVEDNNLVRKMGTIILQELNCQVEAVTTGQLAIDCARQKHFDIIFMDIGLPDIDGLFVIQQIRKVSELNKNAPIIALTAHSDTEYMSQSYEMGATDFLVKPLNMDIGKSILEKYVA